MSYASCRFAGWGRWKKMSWRKRRCNLRERLINIWEEGRERSEMASLQFFRVQYCNRSVMPLDALGRTSATLTEPTSSSPRPKGPGNLVTVLSQHLRGDMIREGGARYADLSYILGELRWI